MEREELKLQLKQHIIKYLNLLEMTPDDIKDDQPLFGEG
ncbi:MAG: acyl carrier protein, partial [Bacteroidetes bacterium CG_4_8_14_3_um_filter_31_14]